MQPLNLSTHQEQLPLIHLGGGKKKTYSRQMSKSCLLFQRADLGLAYMLLEAYAVNIIFKKTICMWKDTLWIRILRIPVSVQSAKCENGLANGCQSWTVVFFSHGSLCVHCLIRLNGWRWASYRDLVLALRARWRRMRHELGWPQL